MANKTYCGGFGAVVEDHGRATVDILPGLLVERVAEADSDGGYDLAGTDAQGPLIIAVERPADNQAYDEEYVEGDDVSALIPQSGALFLLHLAASQTADHGDKVVKAANGQVTVNNSAADHTVVGTVVFDRYDDPNPVVTGVGETLRVKVEIR